MASILKYDFEAHSLILPIKNQVIELLASYVREVNATKIIEDNPDLLVLGVTEDGSWIKRLRSVLYKLCSLKLPDDKAESLGYRITGIVKNGTLYYRFSDKIPPYSFDRARSCWRDYEHDCNKAAKAFFNKGAGGLSLMLYTDFASCVTEHYERGLGRAFILPRRSGVFAFNIKSSSFGYVKWETHIKPILLNHLPTDNLKIQQTSAYIDIEGTYADYSRMWQIYSKKNPYPTKMELNKYANP